jgi:protein-disulfide isomerase
METIPGLTGRTVLPVIAAAIAIALSGCGSSSCPKTCSAHHSIRAAAGSTARPLPVSPGTPVRRPGTTATQPTSATATTPIATVSLQHRLLASAAHAVPSLKGLLRGIPEAGSTLGNPRAPVTLVYYGDLECPVCRSFSLTGLELLIAHDVRAGRVKVVYQALCTATCNNHPTSVFVAQQAAALAAGRQKRFWYYVELFYQAQGDETTNYATVPFLSALAADTPGLNVPAWERALSSPRLSAEVIAQNRLAQADGIESTPALVFTGPRGKAQPPEAVPTYPELETAIRRVA